MREPNTKCEKQGSGNWKGAKGGLSESGERSLS